MSINNRIRKLESSARGTSACRGCGLRPRERGRVVVLYGGNPAGRVPGACPACGRDTERAAVLAKVGPGWLDDPTRERRLRQLVEENLPESRRKAKRDLERLEAEKRSVELGLAFLRPGRRAG